VAQVFLLAGWLVGWGLTALLTQTKSYHGCKLIDTFNLQVRYNLFALLEMWANDQPDGRPAEYR